jgi:putative spermidine/putrescine transport system substrate-binding protein
MSTLTRLTPLVLALLLAGCQSEPGLADDRFESMTWDEIIESARGSTVNMMMWTGDPYINDYMRGYVTDALMEKYGVTLRISSGQGNQIVSLLMTEMEAGTESSKIDMVWINGETFYQLREIEGLHGPFLHRLPNSSGLDLDNPFISVDFQQPIDGYEAPWGNVQFVVIYDTLRVRNPPLNSRELAKWVEKNPGRFTFDASFTGMTFLKSLLVEIAGDPELLAGPFDSATYDRHSTVLWQYLNDNKKHFWRQGETFPESVAQLHQLFVNGEVDFTMSNNDGEVDNKVDRGLFPGSTTTFVLDAGTIQNTHYLGIPRFARNKPAAFVAINFLLSPAAQLEKLTPQVWGDGTVLDIDALSQKDRAAFQSLPKRRYAPPRAEIQSKALMELDPEYMIRLYEDFRTEVVAR